MAHDIHIEMPGVTSEQYIAKRYEQLAVATDPVAAETLRIMIALTPGIAASRKGMQDRLPDAQTRMMALVGVIQSYLLTEVMSLSQTPDAGYDNARTILRYAAKNIERAASGSHRKVVRSQ